MGSWSTSPHNYFDFQFYIFSENVVGILIIFLYLCAAQVHRGVLLVLVLSVLVTGLPVHLWHTDII